MPCGRRELEPVPGGTERKIRAAGRGGRGYSKTGGVYVRQGSKVLRLQETEQEQITQIEINRTNGKVSTEGQKR
jgi:hypothetical protein